MSGETRSGSSLSSLLAMVAIILLATLLRWPWLVTQSIAFDESFSLVVGLAKWRTLFLAILSDGVHPPLFYIVHKAALSLWGPSEFGQRFLGAVFSVFSIALGYKAGCVIFDRCVGLLVALLLALNPLHAWLAQEARMYSLLGALTMISMIAFWRAIRANRRQDWVVLAAANGSIFALHYFGFLVPVIQFAFVIVTFRRNYRRLRVWVAVQLIASAPLVPWLTATALRETQTFGIGFLVQPNILDLPATFWNLTMGSNNLFWPVSVLMMMVIGLILVVALRPFASPRVWARQGRQLVGLWVLLPPIITWLLSQRRSFYADRYLSFVIPGLLLLLAFGAMRVVRPFWRALLIGGLIAASGYGLVATHLDPAFEKDDWRGAASYIAREEEPGDVILLYTTHISFPFGYYYQGDALQRPISLNQDNFPIEPLTAGYRRAWVIYPYTRRPTHYPMQPLMPDGYWASDPARNPLLDQWFEIHADDLVDYQHFPGIQVWLVDLDSTS